MLRSAQVGPGHVVPPAGQEQGGTKVPEVLMSGHHENIRRWRLKQALGRTWLRRPELIAARELTKEEAKLLDEFRQEHDRTDESGARK